MEHYICAMRAGINDVTFLWQILDALHFYWRERGGSIEIHLGHFTVSVQCGKRKCATPKNPQ